jgi:hypothetical protein
MSDTMQAQAPAQAPVPQSADEQRESIAGVVMDAMNNMAKANAATETALISLSAILVASAATGNIPPRAMAAAISALTNGRPNSDDMRSKVAAYVSMIVGMAEKLPGALAAAQAAEAKAGAAAKPKG